MNAFKLVTYTLITLFLFGCGEQVVYHTGDVISDSKYSATVIEVSTLTHIVSKNLIDGSNDIDLVAPDGKVFVVVKYEIKNTTSSNLKFIDFPEIKLKDPESNEIDPDINATSSFTTAREIERIDNSSLSELTPENDAFIKELDQEIVIKPNEISTKFEVFIVSKDKFNDQWNVKLGSHTVTLKTKTTNDKLKTETSNNNKPTGKTSWEDCYNSAYKEISDANAEELIKDGIFKTKDEIPEQALVPTGIRSGLEEDCKEKFKGK